jgi:CheY-like chemotaxis protein
VHAGEVLVVDDDASARELVGRQLQAMGFTYTEACDGEEALLKARVMHPSLIVLDLMMPRMDGFDVLAALRSEGRDVPVIVLTGKTLERDEEVALRGGLAHVVRTGGLAIDAVVDQARQILRSSRRRASKLPRVLYIEDSAQNRDVVRRYLYGEVELLEAEDGEHGFERAKRDVPDLVLMDLSLPRMDGWETTRKIKATPSIAHIPVVAFTAHVSHEDRQRAKDAGCCDYITKPVERDVLLSCVRRRLREGTAPGETRNG